MIAVNAFARMRVLVFTAMLALPAGAVFAQPTAFAAVEGGRVWYQSCGSGPKALVLIHDAILDSAVWDDVWPLLCREFRVVRYDRRGYGRSPAAAAPYTPTDDLWAVMQAAGLQQAVLVASSAGGGIAVNFALQHPTAVGGLVLAGPMVSGLAVSRHFIEHSSALLRQLKRGDMAGAFRAFRWGFAPGSEAARQRAAVLLTANPQDIGHADPARASAPARPLLAQLKTPTLILIGEYDSPDAQGWAGALEALIPGAKRTVVEDAGHLMYLEHPAPFAQLVGQFAGEQ